MYVETRLKGLPGALRREAELRMIQVLNEAENRVERQAQTYQPQPQQEWQPNPDQWHRNNQGSSTSVWGSQSREWMQTQYPQQRLTSPPPMASASSTSQAAATAPIYTDLGNCSFSSLLGRTNPQQSTPVKKGRLSDGQQASLDYSGLGRNTAGDDGPTDTARGDLQDEDKQPC